MTAVSKAGRRGDGGLERRLKEACLLVAEHYHPRWGTWAYDTYTKINHAFFDDGLPWHHEHGIIAPVGDDLVDIFPGRREVRPFRIPA